MAKIHNLGFPRIGADRELKKALEKFWKGDAEFSFCEQVGKTIRTQTIQQQSGLDFVPVNDFSNYDHVLDMSVLLGNIPSRYQQDTDSAIDTYFKMARGRSANTTSCTHAQEMTKWFDTNYHYLVPEFTADTTFTPNTDKLVNDIKEAQALGVTVKPVLIGPLTYLFIGKAKDNSNPLDLLTKLLPAYSTILDTIASLGVTWVQLDEPILVTELDAQWTTALTTAYTQLSNATVNCLLATYFGSLQSNIDAVCALPVDGIHVDGVRGNAEITTLAQRIHPDQVLSVGIIDGRNIWKSNLNQLLDQLEPIHQVLSDRLWVAPSCSLLHVPVSLKRETKLDADIKNWLAFAEEKIDELTILGQALNHGRASVQDALAANQAAIDARSTSNRVHKPAVKTAVEQLTTAHENRQSPYARRAQIQKEHFQLPAYPTTTIGSFPQTTAIRQARANFKRGTLNTQDYTEAMHQEITRAVRAQEELGLDVLVHGEAERNDMVEYFGEQLDGFVFTEFAWVQSYGSRCVKPPIIFGDVSRPNTMTVDWIRYAQSLTEKPMKGMLTGPVTILNWSFVRDDQPRATTCKQIALAIRDEVLDLEAAGIAIIQVDEAALREGLPLRKSDWNTYLDWAVGSFKITANSVQDQTQIHTHMCYSEFNDIIESIAAMDADVVTIETSRSQMELLDVFDDYKYPNEIGPGVYDIHSPNIPSTAAIVNLMTLATQRIPAERLWVNPDCGLKTRQWDEVMPALKNMVDAAQTLRQLNPTSVAEPCTSEKS